jgi:hypothetical protein
MQNKISKKIFMVAIEIKKLTNPTKTPKTNGNNFIFKLQKATQLQV